MPELEKYQKNKARNIAYGRAYYARNRDKMRAYRERAKEKRRLQLQKWRAAHADDIRAYSAKYSKTHTLRSRYGISETERARIRASQDGKCGICGREEDVLHVDHDHGTGALRALLCFQCNSLLGLAADDSRVLRAAADYLDVHGAQPKKRAPTKQRNAAQSLTPLPLFDRLSVPVRANA